MPQILKPRPLKKGDTIGIISPCIRAEYARYADAFASLEANGFRVKIAEHCFSDAWEFAGSIEERAADFNAMIADDDVAMLFFGGGEVCNEILPYIDYDKIVRHPKILCSYSDATTVLNAVHAKTGLVTFYGASPRTFYNLHPYNLASFCDRLMGEDTPYQKAAPWKTVTPGACEGVIAGGYLVNFAALYGLSYYPGFTEDTVLLIEDHEMFSDRAMVSKWFANLEHRGVFEKTRGLLFGHYSTKDYPVIDDILRRIGERYAIPVVRCDDFGHGEYNAVIPLGVRARLDTDADTFTLLEKGVLS